MPSMPALEERVGAAGASPRGSRVIVRVLGDAQ